MAGGRCSSRPMWPFWTRRCCWMWPVPSACGAGARHCGTCCWHMRRSPSPLQTQTPMPMSSAMTRWMRAATGPRGRPPCTRWRCCGLSRPGRRGHARCRRGCRCLRCLRWCRISQRSTIWAAAHWATCAPCRAGAWRAGWEPGVCWPWISCGASAPCRCHGSRCRSTSIWRMSCPISQRPRQTCCTRPSIF
ncbi:hypothetical protein SDC9_150389 [bioreactor metagenome]|uniref:Uncharacterized protein n=1 Tax=bioreactor metagenome TaxID=1076179 RepID=A0A645ERL7_9ZZZZ